MEKCIIFGAAEFHRLLHPIQPGDYIIAADGGMKHLSKCGKNPHAILGDFDSLGYVPEGGEVFPVEKDDTDVMLAIRHGLEKGFQEFYIYGGMDGQRLDHTLANYQALSFLRSHGARGYLIGKDYIATVIRDECACFPASAAGILSVFCMGADAQGITLRGLQYNMEAGQLTADYPLGISNHFTGQPAEISVMNGSLLLLWDFENGLPAIR